MSKTEYEEYLESVWSEEHQGFPWWMEEESIKEQGQTVSMNYSSIIADRLAFTDDMPKLAKHEFQYVFVYGTLKRGKPNHVQMKKDCEFITEAYTKEDCFTVRETKQGRIPVMLSHQGEKNPMAARVRGEVYLVRTRVIPRLDVFEQNGYLYRRVKLICEAGSVTIPAWVYLGVKKSWSGDDLAYSNRFAPKKDASRPYYDYVGLDSLSKGVK